MTPVPSIAVVMPCFRVREQVLAVIKKCPAIVSQIIVVDDGCPEGTAAHVRASCQDPRVDVLELSENQGVGGAMVAGYRRALELAADIVVKVDGDGQIDPSLIPVLIDPLLRHEADYVKGNRLADPRNLKSIPSVRMFGNVMLSFVSKVSSGYWNLMDPICGFTAVWASVLRRLPLDRVDRGYFFESDMLFRLNSMRAAVVDVAMLPCYGQEPSSLNIPCVAMSFPLKHLRNLLKRIGYSYLVRDFHFASLEILLGALLVSGGSLLGAYQWWLSVHTGVVASSGTVMLAALPIILGIQLLLSAIHFDISNVPKKPIHRELFRGSGRDSQC